jgi:hypothetical protein
VRERTFARVLRVAEQHLRTRHVEQRVRDIRYISSWVKLPISDVRTTRTVATAHATLHHDDLLTFP